jgi:polysaccharide pyruvyl transferase WcaK-like protein
VQRQDNGLLRILVDTALNTGPAEYQNVGDVSMLQVAVSRLTKLWPLARIEVLTESPDNLVKYCPGAQAVARAGRDLWCSDRESLCSFFFTRVYEHLPNWCSSRLNRLILTLEKGRPSLLKLMIRMRPVLGDAENYKRDLIAFLEAMEETDLLFFCGAGGFSDGCRTWNFSTLNTLKAAIRHSIPTVMVGQQMGPLNDPEILTIAKDVLPQVRLITLRGGRGGLALLETLGVDTSQVLTTGDEAVELAYEARTESPGQGLGINLRVASYAELEENFVEKLRPVLQDFARRHSAPMIPIPIAFHAWASDHTAIRELLAGFDDESDGGSVLDTPLKVIKEVGRCRVVTTGAYHAAVFALAQGIPTVCLAKSDDYIAKFLGLKDQFGQGCETVLLRGPDLFERLTESLERAWQSAETVRGPLLEAALRQITLSRSAYERVRGLLQACVEKDQGGRGP